MKMVEILTNSQISKRKGELFSRIGSRKLHLLLNEDKNKEDVHQLISSSGKKSINSYLNIDSESKERSSIMSDLLLLDVRDDESYRKYHIKYCTLISDTLSCLLCQSGPTPTRAHSICRFIRKTKQGR